MAPTVSVLLGKLTPWFQYTATWCHPYARPWLLSRRTCWTLAEHCHQLPQFKPPPTCCLDTLSVRSPCSLHDRPAVSPRACGLVLPLGPDPHMWSQHRMWVCVVGLELGHLLASVPPGEAQACEELVLSSLYLLPPYNLSWEFNTPVHTLTPPDPPPQLLPSGADPTLDMRELYLTRWVLILLTEKWRHILAIELMEFASGLDVGEREEKSKIPKCLAWPVGWMVVPSCTKR